MTQHPTEERLNDYVDELLAEAGRCDVERHLAGCDECRGTVDELRSLVRRARELPELSPDRDLLPAIRRSTVPAIRRHRWGALAASLLIVGSAALGALLLQQRSEPETVAARAGQAAAVSEDPALAELRAAEAAFAQAAQVLLETLEARRGQIPAEMLAALEENITLIDESIEEVRRSLGAGGADGQSERALAALYQRKMQLLWRVSRLSS